MSSKRQINVGAVKIGGGAPISVQTMTNTDTEDIDGTLAQIQRAVNAGCDIIRVSCPTKDATVALKKIVENSEIPIIADIHFNHKRAIEAIESGAKCIRVNPGNIGDLGMKEIVKSAKDHGVSIRIGVNSGSLEKELLDKYKEPTVDALVESAVLNSKKLEDLGFSEFKVSVKSSDVKTSIEAYRKLSKLIDYPLHVGITEAGPLFSGTIKSSIGIGSLLADGIGDTIRVSLSCDPVEEIRVGRQILKSLCLLKDSVNIVSCPTCARTLIDVVNISKELEDTYQDLKKSLRISILGCVVNGPGEAREADIGIFGFQKGVAKIYAKGKEYKTCNEHEIIKIIEELINEF